VCQLLYLTHLSAILTLFLTYMPNYMAYSLLIYLADLHNYARMVWPRVTKFGMGEKHIYRWSQVSHIHVARGCSPILPVTFWDPYQCPNGLTYSNKIWYGNTWGTSVFMGGHPSQGAKHPQLFWDPLCTAKFFDLQQWNLVW